MRRLDKVGSLACRAGENKALLQNATYGLSALKAILDAIEGSGFATGTDSLKILSDVLDAIEGSGFATGTDSLKVLSDVLDLIEGSGFSTTTDSLKVLSDVLDQYRRSEQLTWATGASTIPANTTGYIYAFLKSGLTGYDTTEITNATVIEVTRAGTIKNLAAAVLDAAGAGQSYVYTVRKNGAGTVITCTISGATDKRAQDLVNSVTAAVGDYLTIQVVTSAGAAATRHTVFLEFEG